MDTDPGPGSARPGQYRGRVLWFNVAKGFGFLSRAGGPDVFVHYSAVLHDGYKLLRGGDEVEFDIVEAERGPEAANVLRSRPAL